MPGAVLDASAILALLNQEKGAEDIKKLLPDSVMSSVNIAEVAAILVSRHQVPLEEVSSILNQLIGNVINFNEEQAYLVAELELINKQKGYNLSLADKCCIALGVAMDMPIYTADRMWEKIRFKNAKIYLIR